MDTVLLVLYLVGLTILKISVSRRAPIVISTGSLVIVILMANMAMLLPYIAIQQEVLEKGALNILLFGVGIFYLAWLFSGLLRCFVRK